MSHMEKDYDSGVQHLKVSLLKWHMGHCHNTILSMIYEET